MTAPTADRVAKLALRAVLGSLALLGTFLVAHPAAAEDGADDRPGVTVTGGGCQPRSLVVFTSEGKPAGSTTSDHLGNFSSEAELPPGANPRRPELTVTCGPVAVGVRIDVASSAEPDSAALALAGTAAGTAVVTTGLVAVIRRRRRDRDEPAQTAETKEAAGCAS